MDRYSPFTQDLLSSTTEGEQIGGVAPIVPDEFLTKITHRSSLDISPVQQRDPEFSINSFPFHDHSEESNEIVPSDDDVPKNSRVDKLLGRQDGFYSRSYPVRPGDSAVSVDISDLQQLMQATSHMNRFLSQDESSHKDNNSHSTDRHQTDNVFHGEIDSRDEISLIGLHQAFSSDTGTGSHPRNTSTTNKAVPQKKTHPNNWVSFEDEDGNVDSSSISSFTVSAHHPTDVVVKNHLVITDQHSINSSIDKQLTDIPSDMDNGGRTRLGSRRENNEAEIGSLTHLQPLVTTATLKQIHKRATTPISIQGNRSFRHTVASSPASGNETEYSEISLHNEVSEKNESLLQHKRLMLLRPHSVDTPMRITSEGYDPTADLFDAYSSTHKRRTQYFQSHNNSKHFSLPADSNLKPAVKDSVESKIKNGKPTIFRTSSSASLQGDSFISTSAPNSPSREPWKKTLKWISVLLDRKGSPAPMPIDDSMDFRLQPSPLPKNKIINADSNSFKANNGSADQNGNCNLQEDSDTVIEQEDPEVKTKGETKTAVYKKRWYLLLLFSLSAMLWNAVWSTWGPIAQSAKDVYDWTDGDIAMFIWLGNIPFLLTMFPASYLMDVKGMRIAMIVACGFMFLGTGFRCIPSDIPTATWLIRIGQFLNGMAGTIPNSAPALLSGLWFPPNQRATATAISTVAGYLGASVSFVIGPLLVPQPNDLLPVNNTDDVLSADFNILDTFNMTNVTTYNAQKEGIMTILYGEFAVAGLLLLLVLIYFPSKPPLPPSVSASMPREKYIPGLKMLVRNKQFWVCAIAFSVPAGVYEAWQVILDVILDDKGVSQQTAGWLDFYATLGGCVSGLLVSRFADFFTRQMKLFLLIFYFFAAVAILWFSLVVFDILPFDRVSMYAAIIIAGVFLDGGGPLFFELTIEVSYPVGEGVTSGFTQMLCAAAGIVFLSVVQVESLGKEWINWYFLGCVAMAIPPLFFITTTYGRADLDDAEDGDEEEDEPPTPSTDEKTYLFGSSHV